MNKAKRVKVLLALPMERLFLKGGPKEARAYEALKNYGCETIQDIVNLGVNSLNVVRSFGVGCEKLVSVLLMELDVENKTNLSRLYHSEEVTLENRIVSVAKLKTQNCLMKAWIEVNCCEKCCKKDRDPDCFSCQAWDFLDSLDKV